MKPLSESNGKMVKGEEKEKKIKYSNNVLKIKQKVRKGKRVEKKKVCDGSSIFPQNKKTMD